MTRTESDSINAYLDNLNPFAGWTFGAYASEVGQFGVGELKGAVNFVSGSVVVESPLLTIADDQLGGKLSSPVAARGESQGDGADFIQVPLMVGAAAVGDPEEAAVAEGSAAVRAAGAESKLACKGGNCFVAGTPVQMADGTTKPIEQVKTGDYVKSRNPQTGKTEAKRVDRTYVRVAPQVLTLTFTDAHTGQAQTFTCTPEHPFYVDGQGYVKAGELGIGTSIVTRAGPRLTLSTTVWNAPVGQASGNGLLLDGQAHSAGVTVYNLRVEDFHNYFVGTQDGGTCVHNANYPIKVVPGGEGENLAQEAAEYRRTKGMPPLDRYNGKTGNVAVFEYEETVEGETSLKTSSFHAHGGKHAEEHGLEALEGKNITRVFSERHPCDQRFNDCLGQLHQKAPNAKLYYKIPYFHLGK